MTTLELPEPRPMTTAPLDGRVLLVWTESPVPDGMPAGPKVGPSWYGKPYPKARRSVWLTRGASVAYRGDDDPEEPGPLVVIEPTAWAPKPEDETG
jgi:hypothetical protein